MLLLNFRIQILSCAKLSVAFVGEGPAKSWSIAGLEVKNSDFVDLFAVPYQNHIHTHGIFLPK